MRSVRFIFLTFIAFTNLASRAGASTTDGCGDPNKIPACSYTITNGTCTVTIDRLNPVTPPTIYVKPTCKVQVIVQKPYPLERLTLDWKSNTTVIPPDTFSNAFTALSTNLGKITILGRAPAEHGVPCEDIPAACTDAESISRAQSRTAQNADAVPDPYAAIRPEIEQIKLALLPPPGGGDTPGQPWTDTGKWQTDRVKNLTAAAVPLQKIKDEQTNLAADIETLKEAATTPAQLETVRKLTDNQKVLDAKVSPIADALAKINALAVGIGAVSLAETGIIGNSFITDTTPGDKNYQSQTWSLDYSNKLLPLAKRVAADPLKSQNAAYVGSLADASDKQSILTLTVQFQSTSRIELSTGLMVPFTPYHSYAKGSDDMGNATVQATTTYAVVPIALINYRVIEWITKQQPSAFFLTGGVGVNSVTTQVEFGAGLTYSYRSLAFSLLADIGRDTNLGGSLTPGGSLGLYTVVPTTTSWVVKPAAALSVRIPLGGGASAPAASK
jgi:phage gp37-like protein